MAVNTVLLSLGSNMGDRLSYLQEAVDQLSKIGEVSKCSKVYETPPWGFEADQSFYNICLELKTELNPQELLINNQAIESNLGRVKLGIQRYESRVIDIDILFFGSQLYFSQFLQIPHNEYQNRDFVLFPLNEIASEFIEPLGGKKIRQIIAGQKKVTAIKPIRDQIFINK